VVAGDLEFGRFEAKIRFTSPAHLPFWSGNALRSGFGARLKDLVCLNRGSRLDDECIGCLQKDICVYDYFYNAHPPPEAKVLRRQSDPPRAFTFEPPKSGKYEPEDEAFFGFTLFVKGIQHLPYFLLAVRNLGEVGPGIGYRTGSGKFNLESVDSLGYGKRLSIFKGDTVFNKSILLSYQNILRAAKEYFGEVHIKFDTPTQIKENDRFTAAPSFRGFMSRLLSVAISAGATREEMLEAAAIGGLVRLGSGFASASVILDEEKK
jgi:hypothetical protein